MLMSPPRNNHENTEQSKFSSMQNPPLDNYICMLLDATQRLCDHANNCLLGATHGHIRPTGICVYEAVHCVTLDAVNMGHCWGRHKVALLEQEPISAAVIGPAHPDEFWMCDP